MDQFESDRVVEMSVSPPVDVRGGSLVVRERGGSQGLQLSPCLFGMFCQHNAVYTGL